MDQHISKREGKKHEEKKRKRKLNDWEMGSTGS